MTSTRTIGRDSATLRVQGWDGSSLVAGTLGGADPLGFAAGDANLYRYVGNDPTDQTDPSGLLSDPIQKRRRCDYSPWVSGQPTCDEHLPWKDLLPLCGDADQKKYFMQGCIGLCGTRLGFDGQLNIPPQLFDGTRSFTDYEDAKAVAKQLDDTAKKDGRSGKAVIYAVDSLAVLTPIKGGRPSEVSNNFDQGKKDFDYLTRLQWSDGTIVWEHANYTFKKEGAFVIHTYLDKPAPLSDEDVKRGKTRAYCVSFSENSKTDSNDIIPPPVPYNR